MGACRPTELVRGVPVFTSGHDEGADMMAGLYGLEVSFRCRLYTLIYFVAMYLAREVTWVITSAFLLNDCLESILLKCKLM